MDAAIERVELIRSRVRNLFLAKLARPWLFEEFDVLEGVAAALRPELEGLVGELELWYERALEGEEEW
jgi:hypothetical protein